MSVSRDDVLQGLRALLGDEQVIADEAGLRTRSHDTWPLRLAQLRAGGEMKAPICAVTPRSVDEVSTALRYLYAEGISVVPRGGGSGVQGGAEATVDSVVLDVGGLHAIHDLDELNLMVTVGAGVNLGRLEGWLNERGYTSGHYPQSIDLAQVGGLVATRSAGQFSTKYGGVEEVVLGVEAVLPDGRVVRIQDAPRRSAGPDLRHIWLGSEGALGVITEVTLRVFPSPAERWTGAYAVPSMRQGLSVLREIMRSGCRPAVLRLHDPVEAQRGYADSVEAGDALVLVLCEGPEGLPRLEGAAIDRIARAEEARPLGPGPVERWLEHRNDVREFYRYLEQGAIVDTVEVTAKWTALSDLYDAVLADLRQSVPELFYASGHASHCYPQGANLYFILGARPHPDSIEALYRSIWSRVMQVVLDHGATICHHHGIGKLRADWLPQELGTAYELLKVLKTGLDPRGLMNPGTLLSQEAPGSWSHEETGE